MKRNQNWLEYAAVATGGIVGASLRECVELLLNARLTDHIPMATLLINWTGSLFLAWFYTMTIWRWRIPQWIRAGVGTGVVGAFTTFSTFTYETAILLDRRALMASLSYLASSVVLGIVGAWGAHYI